MSPRLNRTSHIDRQKHHESIQLLIHQMCVDDKVLRITLSASDADTISHLWVLSGVHETFVKVRIEDHKTKLHSTRFSLVSVHLF